MLMDIINSISTLIAKKSEATIYIQNIGEGFDRPSFFISNINNGTDDLNRAVINNNIFIQIVYFAPWDNYENVDAENQYNTYDILMSIFKKGYFKVGDRAVKIAQLTGGPRGAEIYLTLNLNITEQKQDDVIESPMANEVLLNLKGGLSDGIA
ncbi:phage tail terminator family protein [Clostridium tagluense]|uniref:phage tail terminator family protein n=2 Tax=Clostridium tagluense TaxID=360422 RepID=UPI001C6ED15D|nr:hypothetical protein [Clostridium tagluense]MBW9158875.1 hypothetical protein [Clostridium tagluense]